MAYASLLSLAQTTAEIIFLNPISHNKKQRIRSIYEPFMLLQEFLEEFREKTSNLEGRIRDVAHEAEDIIVYFILKETPSNWCAVLAAKFKFKRQMKKIKQQTKSIGREMRKIKRSCAAETEVAAEQLDDSPKPSSASSKNADTVGLHDDFVAIMCRLYGESSHLQVIPIVGMTILHKCPEFARVRKPTARVAIAYTMSSVNVEEIWKLHHGDDAPETKYDSESMEDLCSDELQFLVQYVRGGGERPIWGDSSGWLGCDKVIVVCNFSGHWVVCKLNLTSCTITMFDSLQHMFTSKSREQRVVDTRPLARIVPVLLMHAGFWEHRQQQQQRRRLTQWPVEMPKQGYTFVQTDSHSCDPLACMHVCGGNLNWMDLII